jgi:hypothetical protein
MLMGMPRGAATSGVSNSSDPATLVLIVSKECSWSIGWTDRPIVNVVALAPWIFIIRQG